MAAWVIIQLISDNYCALNGYYTLLNLFTSENYTPHGLTLLLNSNMSISGANIIQTLIGAVLFLNDHSCCLLYQVKGAYPIKIEMNQTHWHVQVFKNSCMLFNVIAL